ncbi:hypothetical protein NDU88_003663 [Pleurodeles waltl]|uniref:Uncharacterized protein n=1 Tax=Pleurodeles waltl TaxID=8319 RepID=A0AAV7QAP3_PLEWA|nr:hypothetical protein NDU88_003663 [Pleurodeles waltl]
MTQRKSDSIGDSVGRHAMEYEEDPQSEYGHLGEDLQSDPEDTVLSQESSTLDRQPLRDGVTPKPPMLSETTSSAAVESAHPARDGLGKELGLFTGVTQKGPVLVDDRFYFIANWGQGDHCDNAILVAVCLFRGILHDDHPKLSARVADTVVHSKAVPLCLDALETQVCDLTRRVDTLDRRVKDAAVSGIMCR